MEKMNPLQAMINGMNEDFQRERSGTQMTLGNLIELLEMLPEDLEIEGLGDLDSYRGYYCDLAFTPDSKKPVKEILDTCRQAMGKVFTGYKGGDYTMGELTPIWIADYGCTGTRLISINAEGTLKTAYEEDE